MFELKDGVKIPSQASGAGREAIYPFSKMEVGQSFAIPKRGRSAASAYGKKNTQRFTVRKMEDGTYRCWRTK